MKKILGFLFAYLVYAVAMAQTPPGFHYQAVVRDDAGQPLVNEEVNLAIDILKGSHDGMVVFSESHLLETNAIGLVNIQVGSLEPMLDIAWGDDLFFVQVSMDGQIMGTTQLLSVPYALHAQTSADSFSGDYQDLDNLPELDHLIAVDAPEEGGLVVYHDSGWETIPPGEEGQVLTVVNGLPAWADIHGADEGTVTDVDGNIYQSVQIGSQVWMAENLKTTHFNDGTPIAYPGDNNQAWTSNTTGAYAWYANDESNKDLYGALYNWRAVNTGILCPEGWRVPETSDFDAMIDYLINSDEGYTIENLGDAIKSCRQVNSPLGGNCDVSEHPRWDANNQHHGTDDFGYSALPGGIRFPSGSYDERGTYFNVWTSTERNASTAWSWYIGYDEGMMAIDFMFKSTGYSVRCIKE